MPPSRNADVTINGPQKDSGGLWPSGQQPVWVARLALGCIGGLETNEIRNNRTRSPQPVYTNKYHFNPHYNDRGELIPNQINARVAIANENRQWRTFLNTLDEYKSYFTQSQFSKISEKQEYDLQELFRLFAGSPFMRQNYPWLHHMLYNTAHQSHNDACVILYTALRTIITATTSRITSRRGREMELVTEDRQHLFVYGITVHLFVLEEEDFDNLVLPPGTTIAETIDQQDVIDYQPFLDRDRRRPLHQRNAKYWVFKVENRFTLHTLVAAIQAHQRNGRMDRRDVLQQAQPRRLWLYYGLDPQNMALDFEELTDDIQFHRLVSQPAMQDRHWVSNSEVLIKCCMHRRNPQGRADYDTAITNFSEENGLAMRLRQRAIRLLVRSGIVARDFDIRINDLPPPDPNEAVEITNARATIAAQTITINRPSPPNPYVDYDQPLDRPLLRYRAYEEWEKMRRCILNQRMGSKLEGKTWISCGNQPKVISQQQGVISCPGLEHQPVEFDAYPGTPDAQRAAKERAVYIQKKQWMNQHDAVRMIHEHRNYIKNVYVKPSEDASRYETTGHTKPTPAEQQHFLNYDALVQGCYMYRHNVSWYKPGYRQNDRINMREHQVDLPAEDIIFPGNYGELAAALPQADIDFLPPFDYNGVEHSADPFIDQEPRNQPCYDRPCNMTTAELAAIPANPPPIHALDVAGTPLFRPPPDAGDLLDRTNMVPSRWTDRDGVIRRNPNIPGLMHAKHLAHDHVRVRVPGENPVYVERTIIPDPPANQLSTIMALMLDRTAKLVALKGERIKRERAANAAPASAPVDPVPRHNRAEAGAPLPPGAVAFGGPYTYAMLPPFGHPQRPEELDNQEERDVYREYNRRRVAARAAGETEFPMPADLEERLNNNRATMYERQRNFVAMQAAYDLWPSRMVRWRREWNERYARRDARGRIERDANGEIILVDGAVEFNAANYPPRPARPQVRRTHVGWHATANPHPPPFTVMTVNTAFIPSLSAAFRTLFEKARVNSSGPSELFTRDWFRRWVLETGLTFDGYEPRKDPTLVSLAGVKRSRVYETDDTDPSDPSNRRSDLILREAANTDASRDNGLAFVGGPFLEMGDVGTSMGSRFSSMNDGSGMMGGEASSMSQIFFDSSMAPSIADGGMPRITELVENTGSSSSGTNFPDYDSLYGTPPPQSRSIRSSAPGTPALRSVLVGYSFDTATMFGTQQFSDDGSVLPVLSEAEGSGSGNSSVVTGDSEASTIILDEPVHGSSYLDLLNDDYDVDFFNLQHMMRF